MWLRPRTSAIVFDPGSTALRACQVARRGRAFDVAEWFAVPLDPPDPTAATPATPAPAFDPLRLARLVRQGRFRGTDVALVLSPPMIAFHPLKAPSEVLRLPVEQAQQALAWEIARDTRTEAEALEVRFWPLPAGHSEGLNVMAVSISSEVVRGWAAQFAACDLNLRRVEAAPCAQARAATCHGSPDAGEVWAIADFGLRRTVVTTLLGETPVYVRVLPLCSYDWTRRIAARFDVSIEDAEALKRRFGLTPPEDDSGACSTDVVQAIHTALREDLDLLTRELLLCFKYVLESYPSAAAGRIFLTGGGGALRGLDEFLAANTGLAAEPLTLAGSVGGPPWSGAATEAAGAVGAGLLALEAAA